MDFEKLKSFRNINNNFAKLLGIELTELSDGYAKATMKVTKEFLNPIPVFRRSTMKFPTL